MGQAVHAIPDYNYNPAERLDVGVDLDDDQQRVLLSRLFSRLGDKLIAADVAEMISTRSSSVSYENWVTSDSELISLLDSYRTGGEAQKKTARQKLLHIFLTVSQASAGLLLNRLTTPRKGDLVSDRFNSVFSPSVKTDLLTALRIER
jgi:hypothetical protein